MPDALVMVVDDQEHMRDSLVETLKRAGYRARAFAGGAEALEVLGTDGYDLVITDMRMPSVNGLALVKRAAESAPGVPVVVVTAYGTVENAVEAMRLGAVDYLQKPFKAEELEIVVARALERRRLEAELAFRRELDLDAEVELVGTSGGLAGVWDEIGRVARSSSTVLIRGETGTVKELVARAIHALSPRRGAPFIRVNCAALSAGLLESELFGHEKGAFTGADRQRLGRFELADGGSILLDEVSEMGLSLQGKLLRVLQEREFERVGSSESRRVDVRVLATSNRALEEEIEKGAFRRDLFYRLSVVPILLPPLRERREDIPPLAEHFLARCAREMGAAAPALTEEALAKLAAYDWPGNVRELANVIERAVVLGALARGGPVDAPDLALGSGAGAGPPAGGTGAPPEARTLEQVELDHIAAVLRALGGRRAKAAGALGISERTLRDKVKRLKGMGVKL